MHIPKMADEKLSLVLNICVFCSEHSLVQFDVQRPL